MDFGRKHYLNLIVTASLSDISRKTAPDDHAFLFSDLIAAFRGL